MKPHFRFNRLPRTYQVLASFPAGREPFHIPRHLAFEASASSTGGAFLSLSLWWFSVVLSVSRPK